MNKSELRVGDRIRVIGDPMDATEGLDDHILTIVDLNDDMPCTITAREDDGTEWYIWTTNIMEVIE